MYALAAKAVDNVFVHGAAWRNMVCVLRHHPIVMPTFLADLGKAIN